MIRKTLSIVAVISMTLILGCSGAGRQAAVSRHSAAFSGTPPREAEELWKRAEQEEKAGKTSSAISLWERIAQTYSDNMIAAKALHRAGNKYFELGQPDRAIQFFDYLLYNYPSWEGSNLARLDRLRALWAIGKKKQVLKEAVPLFEDASGQPEVQVPLCVFMTKVYQEENEPRTSFEWIAAGFSSAESPEDRKSLSNAAMALLKEADEATVQRLYSKKLPDTLKVFLEYRLAQIEMQKGQNDAARERLRLLLSQNPSHPLASEIQASLKGAASGRLSSTDITTPPPPPKVTLELHPDRVGCLVPLNGPYAKYGQMVLRGLNSAIEDWNNRNSGQRISLIIRDAPADPDSARKAFGELAKDEGVIGIIGPLGTQSVKAVAPLADEWGIPVLALTQKEEEAANGSYVIHVFLNNRELVEALVRYCREKLGYSRFATLYPDDRYGQNLSKIFAQVVQEQGGSLLASIPYRDKSTDFKDPIQKLMNVAKQNVPPSGLDTTPFEALFIPDQVQALSLIAPQLPYYNVVGATLLGTNLWEEGPLVQAGGAYVEQAIMATPFFPEGKSPRIRAFREKYQSVYNNSPTYLEAQAYDAMMLFLDAGYGLDPSSLDRVSLLQNLKHIRGYQGVAGSYSFSPDGQMSRDYLVLQVSNGELVQVSP